MELLRHSHPARIISDWGNVRSGDDFGRDAWCCLDGFRSERIDIICVLLNRRMVRTIDRLAPGLYVATVATPARLLSNKEADTMIGVVGGFKAPEAQHTAIV